MLKNTFALMLLMLTAVQHGFTQKKKEQSPAATTAEQRWQSFETRKRLQETSLYASVPAVNIGPTIMSGRVTDIEVNPADPTHFYVAYASGGLWETRNNGTTFSPLFDREAAITIGDIAVNWQNGDIWVGTGENNSSRSSYAGMGLFLSEDGGKTWLHKGLGESHHIGRISLNPAKSDDIAVAVTGHLYSSDPFRGIYRSSDKGNTWKQVLFVNENTGGIDLVRDSQKPELLYAASWERSRSAWNFSEGGNGSGVWKSEDGGNTWLRISAPQTGFPEGEFCGRIGLDLCHQEGREILYALVDNQQPLPEEPELPAVKGLKKEDFRYMTSEALLALQDSLLDTFLRKHQFPEKYTAAHIKNKVKTGSLSPSALFEYLYDANEELFNKPIRGPELYRLEQNRWVKTHNEPLDDLAYSYGYYFGQVRVHPKNPEVLYVAGVPLLVSENGGKTFRSISADNVHADHHALWINPLKEGHLINGNDGGINISYDKGLNWIKCNSPAVGQFYTVTTDKADPYNVYGGLQDNGVWAGPSNYTYSPGWMQDGRYPYEFLLGGDGMKVQVDTRDNTTLYAGYQFGHYYRIDRTTGQNTYLHPMHDLGDRPLRWNWQTPLILSRHNQDVVYMGSNRFHRSLDRGDNFETLSGDLTRGGKEGDVPFGTLTCIAESPLQFGLLYTGSDDGMVHVSKDGGYTWTQCGASLPANLYVSRIVASNHAKSRVYLSLNGYRNDHFDSYIFRSEDFGKTWVRLGLNLPGEPVNVILEDPDFEEILYAGTDNGLYISSDGGAIFQALSVFAENKSIPTVAVHDLACQSEARDLVAATHGRSLYRISLSGVYHTLSWPEDTLGIIADTLVVRSDSWGTSWSKWVEPDPVIIPATLFIPGSGEVVCTLESSDGAVLRRDAFTAKSRGLFDIEIPLYISEADLGNYLNQLMVKGIPVAEQPAAAKDGKTYLSPGKYVLTVWNSGKKQTHSFEVKAAE